MKKRELSPELIGYLKKTGFSDDRISTLTSETRLYHDMGLEGDTAEEMIMDLAKSFEVDLSGFEPERFFPPEFFGGNKIVQIFLAFLPFSRFILLKRQSYAPLKLSMIEDALKTKRWSF